MIYRLSDHAHHLHHVLHGDNPCRVDYSSEPVNEYLPAEGFVFWQQLFGPETWIASPHQHVD